MALVCVSEYMFFLRLLEDMMEEEYIWQKINEAWSTTFDNVRIFRSGEFSGAHAEQCLVRFLSHTNKIFPYDYF